MIFDIEITPNRGDLLSHFGLAREISALTSRSFRAQQSGVEEPRGESLKITQWDPSAFARDDGSNEITLSAQHECPFYSIQKIENVVVGPSPDWLRAKIESVGLRSINNVVDISNFVMLELGQPTHAFDAEKLNGPINVRLAQANEKFLALDGKTYSLSPENLVIADAEKAVGIAGVMGGEDSGVSATTKTVLLESAYFLPANIRRTARGLNLPSDASYRFERGVDPQMILPASRRVTALICDLAGGEAAEKIQIAGELPANPPDVRLRYDRLDQLLGAPVEPETADEILTRFGLRKTVIPSEAEESRHEIFKVAPRDSSASLGMTNFEIPSYRRDLQREVDLIEEVARGHGLEKIPSTDRSRFTPASAADRDYDQETKMRRQLSAAGVTEARTSSLIAREELAKTRDALELRNPLSEDHVALRTSLLPGLSKALAHNLRAGVARVTLFEIGNVFGKDGRQRRMLALAFSGQNNADWRTKPRALDFFDLKGVIQSLGHLEFRRTEQSGLALAAEALLDGKRIGSCGQLTAASAKALDAKGAVLLAELELSQIMQASESAPSFRELERFPAITRDIAMFVAPEVTHAEVLRVIESAREPLLERVELFDLFAEKNDQAMEKKRKSLAYSLTYRDKARTLTGDEVNAVQARIRERLQSEIGAELRE